MRPLYYPSRHRRTRKSPGQIQGTGAERSGPQAASTAVHGDSITAKDWRVVGVAS